MNLFPCWENLLIGQKFASEGCFFINTIYRIDGQQQRIDLFESLNIPDDRLATFVHPLAYVAPNAHLGAGTVVMPHASVSSATVDRQGLPGHGGSDDIA